MPANPAFTVIARQGDTLDALIWREAQLGSADLGAILQANTRLADLGPTLPAGTRVTIPTKPAQEKTRALVQLWD